MCSSRLGTSKNVRRDVHRGRSELGGHPPSARYRWIFDYAALWCLVLLSSALAEPSPVIARSIGTICLTAASIWAGVRFLCNGAPKRRAGFVVLMIFGAAGVFLETDAVLLSTCVWIVGLIGWTDPANRCPTRARCAVVIGMIGTVLLHAPWLWNAVNRLSVLLTTSIFSWLGGGGLGMSSSGLLLLILMMPILLHAAVSARRLLPLAIGIGLFIAYAGTASIYGPSPQVRFLLELGYAALLLMACAAGIRCERRSAREGGRGTGRWRQPAGMAMVFGLISVTVGLPTIFPGTGNAVPRDVLFIDHTLLGSWSTPADAPPGSAFSGATFGQFPQYVEASGHHVGFSSVISREAIDGVDLVVIINPGEPFADEEKETLFAFVRSGGGLLVLGDHTNIGGIMDTVNDLTSPLGLSLAFDSAASEDPGWSRTLRILPPFSGQVRTIEVPVSIGASVEASLHPEVSAFLVGRRAFSDPGDERNTGRALLGNLAFDRGERYGDVVLAAVRCLGRGKVALFGDTSPFQNSALALSYRFSDQLVYWLTNRTGSWRASAVSLLALCAMIAAVFAVRRADVTSVGWIACAAMAGVVCGSVLGGLPNEPSRVEGRIAVIDAAHDNLIRMEPLHDRGVEGLGIGAARNGFLPFIRHRGSLGVDLSTESVVVSVAPTSGFGPREAQSLLDWVSHGGAVILSVGWPQSTAIGPFLSGLGIDIAPIPLGAVRPEIVSLDVRPELPSAWPLEISSDWVSLADVAWENTTYTVIAQRTIGSGWIIVIGDNGALWNANLEGKGFAFAENLALLSYLLACPRGEDLP